MSNFIGVLTITLGLLSGAAFADLKGPEITKEDMVKLAQGENIVKDQILLWPMDETAKINIDLALHYMIFQKPVFVPDPQQGSFRYQVNPDEGLKIKEIALFGVPLTRLNVLFKTFSDGLSAPMWVDEEIYFQPSDGLGSVDRTWVFALGAPETANTPYEELRKNVTISMSGKGNTDLKYTLFSEEDLQGALTYPHAIHFDLRHSQVTREWRGGKLVFSLWAEIPVQLKDLPKPLKPIQLTVPDLSKKESSITFEDCVEVALFKLLSAFLKVHPEKLAQNSELSGFAEKHEFNFSQDPLDGPHSASLRKSWAGFLGERGFEYASGTHEMKATWKNMYEFFTKNFSGFSDDVKPANFSRINFFDSICAYFGPEWSCLDLRTVESEYYKLNDQEVFKKTQGVEIRFLNRPYLRWELEQVFTKGDIKRVTGDTRLIDLRTFR